jgi:hypothetical protein
MSPHPLWVRSRWCSTRGGPSSRNQTSLQALLGSDTTTTSLSSPQVDVHLVVDVLNFDLSCSFEYFKTALYASDFARSTQSLSAASSPPMADTITMNALRDVFLGSPFKFICLDEESRGSNVGDAPSESPTIATMSALASLHPLSKCVSFHVEAGPESGDYFGAALIGKLDQYYRRSRGSRPVFVILSQDRLFRRSLERSFPGGLVVYPPTLTPAGVVPFLRSLHYPA